MGDCIGNCVEFYIKSLQRGSYATPRGLAEVVIFAPTEP